MCYIKSKVYYFGTRRKYTFCNNFTSTGDVNTMLKILYLKKKCDYINDIIAMVKIYNDTFVIHHTFRHDIIYSKKTHTLECAIYVS